MLALFACAPMVASTNVNTWRYDPSRAGQITTETQLTPANVNSATFGKLRSYSVDGYVYAQPLYAAALATASGTMNVVLVATQHDSVYAFNADANQQLWKASLIDSAHGAAAGATTVPSADVGTHDIVPEIGITGTPVIDPSSNTLYVVAKSKENGTYVQRLHALDLLTGNERPNSPVVVAATVAGNGNGSTNGKVSFVAQIGLERVGLLLFDGHVYFATASHGDNGPYHGWVFAYDATTLQQTAVYNTSSNGAENGIWESGAGLAADTTVSSGRLFFANGNGTFDATPPYNNTQDFGNAIQRLDLSDGGLKIEDEWTPFDQVTLDAADTDQGSGGILILPDQTGSHVHELIQVGKNGRIEVLDRDNLGGYNSTYNNVVQEIPGQSGALYSTPAYWNNYVYFWGNGKPLSQFLLTRGLLGTTPQSTSSVVSGFPGASPVISSNGTANGILWAIRSDAYSTNGPSILYAFNAQNVSTMLYSSAQNSARDAAGPAVKFTVPMVNNGQVWVGTQNQVDVYGLLPSTVESAVPTPTLTPPAGNYAAAQSLVLADSQSNTTIYYTVDGSLPTTKSTTYSLPIQVTANTTVQAIAAASGYANSKVAEAIYTIGTQPTINFSNGFASSAGLQLNGSAVNVDDTRLQLTTGGETQGGSVFWTTPVDVSSFSTDFTFQLSGVEPIADGITFTIQNTNPSALGSTGGGLGYGPDSPSGAPGIQKSVAVKFDLYNNAGEGPDSLGFYFDGQSPTVPAVDIRNTGVNLHSGNTFAAHLTYDGSTATLTLTDTLTKAVATLTTKGDISLALSGTKGYVGFTGGTGDVVASQKLLTWVFTSTPKH
jgi:hypothetical protein